MQIIIIGPSSLQNQVMGHFIKEQTGSDCCLIESCEEIDLEENLDFSGLRLILFDCVGASRDSILNFSQLFSRQKVPNRRIILCNLCPDLELEEEALNYGVKGFVYDNNQAKILLKAINAVAEGEVWLSRKKLTECFYSKKSSPGKKKT